MVEFGELGRLMAQKNQGTPDVVEQLGQQVIANQDMPSSVASKLMAKFNNKPLVSALMGNFDVETGGSFDYNQKQSGGGPGRGLMQMEGKMGVAYDEYLGKKKVSNSVDTQLDFLNSILSSDEDYDIGAGHRARFKEAVESGDSQRIAEEFSNRVERPGVPHMERRLKATEFWNNKLGE